MIGRILSVLFFSVNMTLNYNLFNCLLATQNVFYVTCSLIYQTLPLTSLCYGSPEGQVSIYWSKL